MFFKKKTLLSILLIIILLITLSTSVMARDNYAFSAGTTSGGINTIQDINDASNAYRNAGYRTYSMGDPSQQRLWENLYADVQFFSTHGNVQFINFSNCGIHVGDTNSYYIGTNAVHWDADTILVTYSSCNSAGANGNNDVNSITCKTAERGATVSVGFRNTIDAGSSKNWAKRYNDRLAQGYGVLDSVNHANSYIYIFPSVKETQVWHHGDANMKIGKYRSAINTEDERNILNKIGKNARNSLNADVNNIISYIEEYYPNFDINNYEIVTNNGAIASNVNSKESTQITYIDFQLKVGEFVTKAGFTTEIQDGIIKAIYDNNIDIQKQEEALQNIGQFTSNLNQTKLRDMKNNAIKEIENKYTNVSIEDDIKMKYYYDIEEGKKYVVYSIPNVINTETGEKGISYDTIEYEI